MEIEGHEQAVPLAIVSPAALEGVHLLEGFGPKPATAAATSGLAPEVRRMALTAKPAPGGCSKEQLVEIVLSAARRFRAAKDDVSEHQEYILRLKAEVFKVWFGSKGIRAPIRWTDDNGRTARRRLLWNEFCQVFFLVSADWINRVCGGTAKRRPKEKPAGSQGNRAAETDWKAVLVKLVFELGQCGDGLPERARAAVDAAKAALEGRQQGPAEAMAAVQEDRRPPVRPAGAKARKALARFPTISYPGGKARLAPALVALMPREGRRYIEPFAGRGNVFWAAASSGLQFEQWSLNDIRTAPFFEALRDFGGTVEVPPRMPEEYRRQSEAFRDGDPTAVLLEPYLTFGGGGYGSGCRGRSGPTVEGYARTLRACHRLLISTNAGITDRDWMEIDWASLDQDDFVFIDPPYLGARVRPYGENDIDHEALVRVLREAKFKWMLTEYPQELYFRALGQPRSIKDMQLGAVNFQITGGRDRRLECVWKNY